MAKVLKLETAALTVRRIKCRKHFRENFVSLVALAAPAAVVIETEAEVRELAAEAVDDRVRVWGQIAALLYFQDEDHLWRREEEIFDFQHGLDLSGVKPEDAVQVNGTVTLPVCALTEEGHAARLELFLDVLVEVSFLEPVEVALAVSGAEKMRLIRTAISVENDRGAGTARETVEHVVGLPEEAVQLFHLAATPLGFSGMPQAGMVRLDGAVMLQMLYLNRDHALRSHRVEIPAGLVIALPGAAAGQRSRFEIKVLPLQWQLAELPGKNLRLKLLLEGRVNLAGLVSLEALTGVSGSGLRTDKRVLALDHASEEVKIEKELLFSSRLPGPAARLLQAVPVLERVTGRALEEEIAVTGTLKQKLYCLREDGALLFHREEKPFVVAVPLAGCKPTCGLTVEARLVSVEAALTEAERVEQKVLVRLTVWATESVKLGVVSRVMLPEPSAVPTGIYLVQPGDTLSLIAHRFRIVSEELLAANPQVKIPARIAPGERIAIPRSKVPFPVNDAKDAACRTGDH